MKSSTILDKIFLFKNVKIILLIVYTFLTLLFYLNWSYLSSLWFDYLVKINKKFQEPLSIILVFCYCFYCFYGLIFLYYPLIIFDKKYDNDERIEINIKKDFTFKNILLFIISPILLFVGGIVFAGILFIADIAVSIWSLIGLFIFASMLIYMVIYNLYRILKKHYDSNCK